MCVLQGIRRCADALQRCVNTVLVRGAPRPEEQICGPPHAPQEPEEENPPQSPGALNSFRKGIVKTLQTAPQYIMAGAVVAGRCCRLPEGEV